MRRRSGCHRLRRHAAHQFPQPSVGGPPAPKRPPRIPRDGEVNQERLAEYLGELQRKENTNDRYIAALRGETLNRTPYQRIEPTPKQNTEAADNQQKKMKKEDKS